MDFFRKCRLLLTCTAALLFITLFMGEGAQAADVLDDATVGRQIILMGDSYGAGWTPDGMVTGWIAYTKSDLPGVRIESYAYGGEGYSSIGTGRRSILDCLIDIGGWVHDKQNITDIIFVGGAADYTVGPAPSLNGLQILMNYVRANYPNANYINGFCAGSNLPYYKNVAHVKYANTYSLFPNYGAYDIREMAGVLDARDDWFSSDHGHPYAPGQRAIANVLVSYLRNNILIGGPQANGLLQYRIDGRWYVVRNGVVDKSYNGLYYNQPDDTWYYIQRGRLEGSYTGLVPYNGKQYYVQNGTLQWGYDGVVLVNGVPRMVLNSTLEEGYKGPGWYAAANTWYYFENGTHRTDYTGLAYHGPTDTWMYIENGVFNGNYTGLVYYPYSDKQYFVQNGILQWGYYGFCNAGDAIWYIENSSLSDRSGLAYLGYNETWYYVDNGRFRNDYTGFVYFDYNQTWYFVQNGILVWDYYGFADFQGSVCYIENSHLSDRSGFAYLGTTDTWYYLENGRLRSDFTGLAHFDFNDTWYYFQNGVLNWGVTALVPHQGSTVYITNSTLVPGINGDVTVDGQTVHLVNSVVQ